MWLRVGQRGQRGLCQAANICPLFQSEADERKETSRCGEEQYLVGERGVKRDEALQSLAIVRGAQGGDVDGGMHTEKFRRPLVFKFQFN